MKKEKMSLKSIKNVLSRNEMKKIMAGSGPCLMVGAQCGPNTPPCCFNEYCNANQLGFGVCKIIGT